MFFKLFIFCMYMYVLINETKEVTVTQTSKQGEYLNYQKYQEYQQKQRSMYQLEKEKGSRWKMSQQNKHANISNLLDNLLRGYDNSIRPGFGGPPAIIEVDIMVRSMGPISEVDMTYSMDCYFRQSWVDRRLAFKGGGQDTLALSISMLARIWKPDTYFYNGKQSYLHTITTPNKFVRIYPNGRVLYSSRLTIKAGCPMSLEDFPMDVQRCPLKFGSFGYTTVDVLYNWNENRTAVAIAEDMKLSQFDLVDCPAGNSTDIVYKTLPLKEGESISSKYSMLTVNFILKRHMGNFLIQVYGPCCLLVVLSWVSFWLNREATADRVSLGITTVLTMTFLGLEARTDLPKVPYPTALDFFVFLSFAFIFATIIQFAVVHYFTKYGSGECYFIVDDMDSEESETEDEGDVTLKTLTSHRSMPSDLNGSNETTLFEVIPLSEFSIPITPERDSNTFLSWCEWNYFLPKSWRRKKYSSKNYYENKNQEFVAQNQNQNQPQQELHERQHQHEMISMDSIVEDSVNELEEDILKTPSPQRRLSFRHQSEIHQQQQQFKRRRKRTQQFNSVSKIDRASRVIFPVLFILINVFYWYGYLSRSSRIHTTKAIT